MAGRDLGEALYGAIAGGRSSTSEPGTFADAVAWFVAAAGSVAGAARLAGVPRRTFRDWVSGKGTKPGRASGLIAAAKQGERRRRLTRDREQRLRNTRPRDVHVSGSYNYDTPPIERSNIAIGQFLRSGAIDDVIDAYLAGGDEDELRETFADAIDDPRDFYGPTMHNPSSDEHGWTITSLNLEGRTS